MVRILGLAVIVMLVFIVVMPIILLAKRNKPTTGACPGEDCTGQRGQGGCNCQR